MGRTASVNISSSDMIVGHAVEWASNSNTTDPGENIRMPLNNIYPEHKVSRIRSYIKRRRTLRKFLVQLRGIWWHIRFVYLVLGKKGERESAVRSMPVLGQLARGSCSIAQELRAVYVEYTKDVSYAGMPISFESACLLWSLCETMEPERILDMGSGFSSFVFRRYQVTANVKPEILSVDESAEWLDKTREFLRSHDLSDQELFTWDEFQKLDPPQFDLISHDLGFMSERPDILERLLTLRKNAGIIIVDDYQNPVYRAEVDRRLLRYDMVAGFNVRWLTLDRFVRYSMLITQQSGNQGT